MKKVLLLSVAAAAAFSISCTSVKNDVFIKDKAAMKRPVRIAVMPFTDPQNTSIKGSGLAVSDALTGELVKIAPWTVVERSQLEKVMGEKELNMTGLTDADAINIGKLAKTDYIIVGSVTEFEYDRSIKNAFIPKTKLNFKARIIDTATGAIVGTVRYSKETGKYAWCACCVLGYYYIPVALLTEENQYEELDESSEEIVEQITDDINRKGCFR